MTIQRNFINLKDVWTKTSTKACHTLISWGIAQDHYSTHLEGLGGVLASEGA